MRFRKALLGAAFLSAVGLVGSLGLSQANAGDLQPPTPGVALDGHDYTNQFTTGDFTKWIYEQGDVEKIGYAGQINHNEERLVEIYWKGKSHLKDRISTEGQRRGIEVEFKPAKFTAAQQARIGSKIMDQQAKFAEKGIALDSVIGFSGADGRMKVVGNGNEKTKALGLDQAKAKSAMKSLVRELAAPEIASIDVLALTSAASIADQEIDMLFEDPMYGPSINMAGTRVSNTVPTYAGALISGGTGAACSSGFAMRDRSTGAINRFTTARHCKGTYWTSWTGGHQLGRSMSYSGDGAALLIQGTSDRRVFDGSWNNAAGYNKQVWTDIPVKVGDYVCTSGGNSGVHCSLRIDNLNVTKNDGVGNFSTITAYNTTGGIAAVGGDSGGPVVMPYAGETWTAAVGMIQQGTQDKNCVVGVDVRLPVSDALGNRCGSRVYFSSIQTIANTSTHNVAKAG